jgi:hypothetical protein
VKYVNIIHIFSHLTWLSQKKTISDGEKLFTCLNSALKVLLGTHIFPRVPKKKVKFGWLVISPKLVVGPYMALSEKFRLRQSHIRTYFGLTTGLHTIQHTFICQAISYQCSKLTPEDGQGTPETWRVAKIKWKNLDFKLSPCFEYCIYSFGYFPWVILCFADVSESSVKYIHIPHPAFEDGADRRIRNVGKTQSDAGEIPKRTCTIIS